MKKKCMLLEAEAEQEITMFELKREIEEMGTNKSAGRVEIPYEFLRHLRPKAIK